MILATYKGRPHPGEQRCAVYTASYRNGRVVFSGGPFSNHAVPADDLKRINAHWVGYVTSSNTRKGDVSARDSSPVRITRARFEAAIAAAAS
jgi:hypothetical protein